MNKSNLLYVAQYRKPCIDFPENPARKVGITLDSRQRMRALSNGTEAYAPVEAIQLWALPEELPAKKEEDYIHNCLDIFELRTNREWFNGGRGEENRVEEFVKRHMESLIDKGYKIKALHENIDVNDDSTEITSDEFEKIKVKGSRNKLPKNVTINGNKIEVNYFNDILREVFKILIDNGKITSEVCPVVRNVNNKGYLVNTKPQHKNENPFRCPFEYKNLFLEMDGNSERVIYHANFLIDTFGNKEFILNITS